MNRFRGRARRTPQAQAPAAIGQRLELGLERLTHDGRGIGQWQGRTVFVEGGLPGETVRARVVQARSKLIEARLERVLGGDSERQVPACAHADLCGGCNLQHMPHATQLRIKQQALAQQLQHFAGIQPEHWAAPLLGPEYGYRQRTRIAVRWQPEQQRLQVGYRQRGSSELVEVNQCPILVPALEALLKALPAVLGRLQAPQALGHVELIGGERPALLVRHIRQLPAADVEALGALARAHLAHCWLQGEEGQAARCVTAEAEQAMPAYRLADQQLCFEFAPGDFTQVNAEINQRMVNQALDWLAPQPGERILDLFCGVGNFALALARQGAQVSAIEGSEAMVARAAANAGKNALQGLHFSQADLSKPVTEILSGQVWDAALLDPPRDGAQQLVRGLAALGVGRVLYVSCNPATLARDAGLLAEAGYRLERVGIMDMFPHTAHVEAMALFRHHQ